jgi:cation diffusion facilitator CzcD-associated flavoprotein CzcO
LTVGILSAHYIRDFESLDSFQDFWCHTGRWLAEGIALAGKRVGVIGPGATGVQLITEITKEAAI